MTGWLDGKYLFPPRKNLETVNNGLQLTERCENTNHGSRGSKCTGWLPDPGRWDQIRSYDERKDKAEGLVLFFFFFPFLFFFCTPLLCGNCYASIYLDPLMQPICIYFISFINTTQRKSQFMQLGLYVSRMEVSICMDEATLYPESWS